MKLLILLTSVLAIFLLSCTKETPIKYCWVLVDNLGNQVGLVCEKTEAEISAEIPNPCSYYKFEEEKFCWMVGSNYIENVSAASMAHMTTCFPSSPTPVKVPCGSCAIFYSREKRTYKPNGTTSYTSITRKTYCLAELAAIPPDKQYIRKDDADSLIVVQFSANGIF